MRISSVELFVKDLARHHTAATRNGQQIAITCGLGGARGYGTVGAMVVDELFEIGEKGDSISAGAAARVASVAVVAALGRKQPSRFRREPRSFTGLS